MEEVLELITSFGVGNTNQKKQFFADGITKGQMVQGVPLYP